MKRFIEGESRTQSTLFPEVLDEYIAEDNAVRVIDVFVDELDLSGLGFETEPQATGRPAYHAATMLKIYIYGYLNRVNTTRRLEKECQRNVEMMWLTGRLAPDFKTLADFRKDNGKAIRLVCREFVMLCRRVNMFADAFVAIDGSKFKAVNNRDRNFTKAKMKRRLEQIDESIERYLGQLASAERQSGVVAEVRSERLNDKIVKLKEEIGRLKKLEVRMLEHPDQQVSLTDPDARSMATSGRGTGMVGYNVQIAVDTTHHLIVEHEVTNIGHDRTLLAQMATRTKDTLEVEELTSVSDRGYYRGEEIMACEEAGITTYLPKPQTSSNQAKGLFGRRDFIYIAEDDEYLCPAGERAIYRSTREEGGKQVRRYWSSACVRCSIKSQCTTGVERRISRWEHEEVLEVAEKRLDLAPEMMRVRRQTAEHPFATLKIWMGYTHFVTQTLPRVRTEMSLHVLAYNFKRMLNLLGPKALIAEMQAT